MEDVSEVRCVVATVGPRIRNGCGGNCFVAVQVLGTDAGTRATVNGLGHEGEVVGNAVAVGFGHAGHRTFGVLQNHRCSVHIF